MRLTAIDTAAFSRRGFLRGLGALALTPAFARSTLAQSLLGQRRGQDEPLFASAFMDTEGGFGVAVFDDLGQILAQIALPGRGHGVAVSPDRGRIVAFARRPGTFAIVAPLYGDRPPLTLTAEPGRHFYGHGCFSADGRLLYSVENEYEAARGLVGVYDVSGAEIRRLGEIDTAGIGPHDLHLSADGRTLIVANGGIKTHPDRGREKLNLDTMKPSVVYIDVSSGEILAKHELAPELHQVSLRHMALDADGSAWIGGQYEGDPSDTPPLVGKFSRDRAPVLFEIPKPLASGLDNYIGSVTANATGDVIATSAPRGGQTLFWQASSGKFLGAKAIIDGCGVAPIDRGSFIVSDGNGGLSFVAEPDAPAEVLARPLGYSWDNHLSSI